VRNIKLTNEEKKIEEAILRGKYVPVTGAKLKKITESIDSYWRRIHHNASSRRHLVRSGEKN